MIGLATTEVMQMPGVAIAKPPKIKAAAPVFLGQSANRSLPSVSATVWSPLAVDKSSCDYVVLHGVSSG